MGSKYPRVPWRTPVEYPCSKPVSVFISVRPWLPREYPSEYPRGCGKRRHPPARRAECARSRRGMPAAPARGYPWSTRKGYSEYSRARKQANKQTSKRAERAGERENKQTNKQTGKAVPQANQRLQRTAPRAGRWSAAVQRRLEWRTSSTRGYSRGPPGVLGGYFGGALGVLYGYSRGTLGTDTLGYVRLHEVGDAELRVRGGEPTPPACKQKSSSSGARTEPPDGVSV